MKFGRFANSHLFGKEQEAIAASYLRAQGLRLICNNFRSRFGEIDLIMIDDSTLVFIEVRYRRSDLWGSAVETITRSKQRRIRQTAAHYLQSQVRYQHLMCRFDVIGLSRPAGSTQHEYNWIKSAFN